MTTLHFSELDIEGPEALRRLAARALGEFEVQLNRTKAHLESTALRLGWVRVDGGKPKDAPLWVELVDPPDQPEAPDRTFEAFLDDEVRAVFDTDDPGVPRTSAKWTDRKIVVLGRDEERRRLRLSRPPATALLTLVPNTWTLACQLRAVRRLKHAPLVEHVPLLRLFESSDFATWPELDEVQPIETWFSLKDESRPGTTTQRRFVEIALATPDFAVLEGPPGSGKTTAITELVMQFVRRGSRVLLCASTHVAVDNVLERLAPWSDRDDSDLIAVRIGDHNKVSADARRFRIDEMEEVERRRLITFLGSRRDPSDAQRQLLDALQNDTSSVTRLLLDSANVVCGTTVGILRHPDLNVKGGFTGSPPFDVLILDEASKTTFHEFLVPALLAKRWVIVGDPRQLSPYVEQAEIEANLQAAVPDRWKRDACADAARVGTAVSDQCVAHVVATDPAAIRAYEAEGKGRGIVVARATDPAAAGAKIVLGSVEELLRVRPPLGSTLVLRGSDAEVRRVQSVRQGAGSTSGVVRAAEWEKEVAWRVITKFQLRYSYVATTSEDSDANVSAATKLDRLQQTIDSLLPKSSAIERAAAEEVVSRACRVALPSIIEVLRVGNDRRPGQRDATAMTDGLPEQALKVRHILLEHQHRMHPAISAVPREHVYDAKALIDVPGMEAARRWTYPRHEQRAVWAHVPWVASDWPRQSEAEAEAIDEELRRFVAWGRTVRRADGHAWEVAVLPFYRAQERLLRGLLRDRTGQREGYRHFHVGDAAKPVVRIELCTVDRFQGHEADVVIVSFASAHPTSFLECQNRLNVALTRPRFLRVLVGDRDELGKSPAPLLRTLARDEPWCRTMGGGA